MPIAFRDPGFRFFEPAEDTQTCILCEKPRPDTDLTPNQYGNPVCHTCNTGKETS